MSFASGFTKGIPVGAQIGLARKASDRADAREAREQELYTRQLEELDTIKAERKEIEAATSTLGQIYSDPTSLTAPPKQSAIPKLPPGTQGTAPEMSPIDAAPTQQRAIGAALGQPNLGAPKPLSVEAQMTVAREAFVKAVRGAKNEREADELYRQFTQIEHRLAMGKGKEAVEAASAGNYDLAAENLRDAVAVYGADIAVSATESGDFLIPALSDKPVGMDKVRELLIMANSSPKEFAQYLRENEALELQRLQVDAATTNAKANILRASTDAAMAPADWLYKMAAARNANASARLSEAEVDAMGTNGGYSLSADDNKVISQQVNTYAKTMAEFLDVDPGLVADALTGNNGKPDMEALERLGVNKDLVKEITQVQQIGNAAGAAFKQFGKMSAQTAGMNGMFFADAIRGGEITGAKLALNAENLPFMLTPHGAEIPIPMDLYQNFPMAFAQPRAPEVTKKEGVGALPVKERISASTGAVTFTPRGIPPQG